MSEVKLKMVVNIATPLSLVGLDIQMRSGGHKGYARTSEVNWLKIN